MAAPTKKINLSGLARKLVLDGLLDEEKALATFEESLKKKKPFVSLVVENKLVASSSIALAAANEFGAPLVDIDLLEIDPDIVKLVKEDLIKKHHALPIFKRGKRLAVAVSDPTNIQALDEFKFATSLTTDAIIVEEDKLVKNIDKALEDADGGLGDMDDEDFEDLDDLEVAEDGPQEQDDSDVDDAPVVRFVNKVLLDAIKKGASDLHFEPYEKSYRVRFRIDGVLQEVANLPWPYQARLPRE